MKEVRVDKREMKEIGQKELKKGDGGRGKGESRREERRRERREVKRKREGKGEERVSGTLIPDFCHYIQLLLCAHRQAYTTTYLSRIARRGAGLAIWAASLDSLIISHKACEAFPHC